MTRLHQAAAMMALLAAGSAGMPIAASRASRVTPPPEPGDGKPRFAGGVAPPKGGIVTDLAVLTQPSLPYEGPFGDDLTALTDRMFEAMYASRQGVGLAAVQIGVHLRVCVVDIYALSSDQGRRKPRVFVNPKIERQSIRKVPMREGCLSAPAKFGDVERAISIYATWQDEHGEHWADDLGGFLAHILQHEVDHMDGIMCTSKMVRS